MLCFIFFIYFFLHCPLSGPVLTYISLLIIPCMIVYVTNKQEPWTYWEEMFFEHQINLLEWFLNNHVTNTNGCWKLRCYFTFLINAAYKLLFICYYYIIIKSIIIYGVFLRVNFCQILINPLQFPHETLGVQEAWLGNSFSPIKDIKKT